jgi:hypothetical protein
MVDSHLEISTELWMNLTFFAEIAAFRLWKSAGKPRNSSHDVKQIPLRRDSSPRRQ